MSILKANLKHLYQRRILWLGGFFYIFFTIGVYMTLSELLTEKMMGGFCVPLIWMFLTSLIVTSLQVEILSKPTSFCLPGHRYVPRKCLFTIGLSSAFIWSICFVFFLDLNFINTILACLSAFSMLTMVYWLAACAVFRFRSWAYRLLEFFCILMLIFMAINISKVIEFMILKVPVLTIIAGAIVNIFAWQLWGRPDIARRFCTQMQMAANDALKNEKERKKAALRTTSDMENYFLKQIRISDSGSIKQYIWGSLYRFFGPVLSWSIRGWLISIIVALLLTCVSCYLQRNNDMIIVIIAILSVQMRLLDNSSLLICAGRSQRFWSILILSVISGVLFTVLTALLDLLTGLLQTVMPQFNIGGSEFPFEPLSIGDSLIPLLVITFTLTMQLIFSRKNISVTLFIIVLFQLLLGMTVIGQLNLTDMKFQINNMNSIIILLISWALYLIGLYWFCCRSSLVNRTNNW